jgi:uncharacterized protein
MSTGTLATALPADFVKIATDPSTEPFWQAARERRLVAPKCADCGAFRLPDITLVPVVVDLPDAPGARLVSNVIGVDPAEVRIGTELTVDFQPISDGWLLPVFRVASRPPKEQHQ